MKQKALILGAEPPFVGPWVPILEARQWHCLVKVNPVSLSTIGAWMKALNGQLIIRVTDKSGSVTVVPHGSMVEGAAAQAEVKEIEGIDNISVFLEEAEGA
jgi:hypothetical protein